MILGWFIIRFAMLLYILVIYSNMANHYITILYHISQLSSGFNYSSNMIRVVATLVYPL